MTQRSLAIILRLEENTITKYENDSIQEQIHDVILRLIENVEVFKKLWKHNKRLLENPQEIQKVEEILMSEINNF